MYNCDSQEILLTHNSSSSNGTTFGFTLPIQINHGAIQGDISCIPHLFILFINLHLRHLELAMEIQWLIF